MAREGQLPPPDHVDKPVAAGDPDAVGERLTGKRGPKDPDGLLTVDGAGETGPDLEATSER
ncbi:hypothetical protein [Herbiconiux sp. L3-i23]|uniref:hypothetical protein n=1 Tax=Herbiconiux sp. L3-i23 TaxID=2905871 RepID=UPI0020669ACE|nr:hypothetical protein [Herbiconiux sp. L3-i23]BDI22448.1 hypothetical protein L3i23_12240 [Herbiconiux sp. L3-i23]